MYWFRCPSLHHPIIPSFGDDVVQGDMEGVRQQTEQHLASAHAEARSIIQKAQTTAADLQVNALHGFCPIGIASV